MQITIKDNEITTAKGIKLNEVLAIEKVTIEQEYIKAIDGNNKLIDSKAIIEANMVNTSLDAQCELLIDFSEMNDDNLVYVMDELTMVMEERGLVK